MAARASRVLQQLRVDACQERRVHGVPVDAADKARPAAGAAGFVTLDTLPHVVIRARGGRYGTYASGQYTASPIPAARCIGFDTPPVTRTVTELTGRVPVEFAQFERAHPAELLGAPPG